MKTKEEMCATCIHAENFDPMNEVIYCQLKDRNYNAEHWCEQYEYFTYY
jgi:hypothetical protein